MTFQMADSLNSFFFVDDSIGFYYYLQKTSGSDVLNPIRNERVWYCTPIIFSLGISHGQYTKSAYKC